MRRLLARFAALLAIAWCLSIPRAAFAAVPAADHVIVVIMENKSFGQARSQPYTASLMTAGAWFAQSFGIVHPSQPNYFVLWSGATQGVANDACPPLGAPFSTPNLGQALEAAGKTWRAYSENLPTPGAPNCSFDGDSITGLYTRKHDPWTYFTNVDHMNERPYSDLAADIAAGQLPNLSFVIPNNCHNSHNTSDPNCTLANADLWLSQNLTPIVAQLGPRDVLMLTWDEDNGSAGNNILTVFVGPLVLPGSVSVNYVSHYTVTRTISDLLGVPPPGQSAGVFPISDVWAQITPAQTKTWGSLKLLYR